MLAVLGTLKGLHCGLVRYTDNEHHVSRRKRLHNNSMQKVQCVQTQEYFLSFASNANSTKRLKSETEVIGLFCIQSVQKKTELVVIDDETFVYFCRDKSEVQLSFFNARKQKHCAD